MAFLPASTLGAHAAQHEHREVRAAHLGHAGGEGGRGGAQHALTSGDKLGSYRTFGGWMRYTPTFPTAILENHQGQVSRGVPKVMCLRGCVPKVVKSDGILFVSLNRVTKEAIWRHAFSEFG